jgi:hypothetical protein
MKPSIQGDANTKAPRMAVISAGFLASLATIAQRAATKIAAPRRYDIQVATATAVYPSNHGEKKSHAPAATVTATSQRRVKRITALLPVPHEIAGRRIRL